MPSRAACLDKGKTMNKNSVLAHIIIILSVINTSAIAQGLILTAPPRETPDAGMKIYGPIADYLSKFLATEVTYQHPSNWLNYQRELRNDNYDIVFDGPHFISWRIQHLQHEALLKLPGKLQFHLVAASDDEKINKADDLIGKNICGISPPNLSTLSVLDYYRNPVRQPIIKGIKGGMGKVYKIFSEKIRCQGAVFRTAFYKKKLNKEQQDTLKIIFTSKAMPNQGISVSKRVTSEQKRLIKAGLITKDGQKSTKALLKRFGGKAKTLISAKSAEYANYNNLLEGVIFGW